MTSTFTSMDYNKYPSSPSASPQNNMFLGLYLDSNSDTSSPSSPHSSQPFQKSVSYDAYQYTATLAQYQPAQDISTRIPVTLVSSSLDHKDRRRKSRTESIKSTSDKETIPSTHLRRRAQNRASQRAFRERKEKHVKNLEHQLEELHEKHQDLLQSYSNQVNEVSQLNSRIAQLSAELNSARHCQDTSFNEVMIPERFDKFDAFQSTELMYQGSNVYFQRGFDIGSGFPMYPLEDSL